MKILMAVLVFLTTFFIIMVLCSWLRKDQARVAGRLELIRSVQRDEEEDEPVAVARKQSQGFGPLNRYFQWTAGKLEGARLLYRPQEFLAISVFTSLLVVMLAVMGFKNTFIFFGVGPVGYFLLILISAVVGFLFPQLYLSIKEGKQRELLSGQVGNMLMLLANYLRAGHGFTRAMEIVSREIPSPLSEEIKKFAKDITLGRTIEVALDELEKRTGDEDLGLAIIAVNIQHEVGGNLSEILDKINHTIRERVRLKGEIKTLTAQGRLTAVIISLLPIALAVIIFCIYPDFLKILFSEPVGRLMLIFAIAAQVVGILLIRKIVQIEV